MDQDVSAAVRADVPERHRLESLTFLPNHEKLKSGRPREGNAASMPMAYPRVIWRALLQNFWAVPFWTGGSGMSFAKLVSLTVTEVGSGVPPEKIVY
jgi:hypothetical protein